jgi:23S rRNA pseudouridine2605 synthase
MKQRSAGRGKSGFSKGPKKSSRGSSDSKFKRGSGRPAGAGERKRSTGRDGESERSFKPRGTGARESDSRSRDVKGEFENRSRGFKKAPGSDGDRPYKKRDDSVEGEFKTRSRSSEGGSFERKKSFGDRDRKSSRTSGDRPYRKREDGDSPSRGSRSYGDKKPFDRDSKSSRSSGDRPFRKREDGDRPAGGSRSYGDKKPFDRDSKSSRSSGDRPFRKREDGDRPAGGSRSYGDKKPFDRDNKSSRSSGDRPFRKREDGDRPERGSRSYGDKKPFDRDNKPSRSSGDRPFRKRTEGDGESKARSFDDKKPFEKREDGSSEFKRRPRTTDDKKPFEKKEFGDRRKAFGAERTDGFKRDSGDSGSKWNRKEKHEFYGDRKKSKAPNIGSDDGSVRLNKFIANAGICSRREADELITAGVISVNGEVVTEMGYKVQPDDIVKYNNESLRSERLVYILLNKPKDFITTTDDPEDRKTVMSLIAKACKERVYPVGRLDRNTTGVLLFTNDGDLAKKLTHPSFEVHKVYQVELDRAVKGTDLESIREGVRLEDGTVKADEVVHTTADKNVVGIELHSGKNRIVRRIFEHLGYEVKKLDRVIFAGLTKKDLPRGRWRFLTEMEVAGLKMMTGKKVISS